MSEPLAGQTRGFLFADLRDYTRFVESYGDQAAAELLARYRMLVRGVIAQSEGAEIRTEGDSFYVVFPSASAAVRGGLAILDAARADGGGDATGAIKVGIGVHAGETAETPEGFVGSAVNLAARLCALAGPGELLVSDTVRGLTRTFLAVRFVPLGQKHLKGIAEPVPVYRVVPTDQGTPTRAPTRRDGRTSRASLAVATVVVGLVAIVVVAIALLGGLPGVGRVGGVSPSTGPSDPAVSAGTPTSAAAPSSALTAAEEALRARLPAAIKADCAPATVAEGSAGGSVSLHCELPLSAKAEEVWIDQFPSPEALRAAFAEMVARTGAPSGDCRTAPFAHGAWAVRNVFTGSQVCYQDGSATWLAWTYDGDRIMAKARRGGDAWLDLFAWWRETAIFLR